MSIAPPNWKRLDLPMPVSVVRPPRRFRKRPSRLPSEGSGHGDCRIIGFHLAERLLAEGYEVIGFDGMTPYYDAALKQRRHALLRRSNAFHAVEGMLEDKTLLVKSRRTLPSPKYLYRRFGRRASPIRSAGSAGQPAAGSRCTGCLLGHSLVDSE